MRPEVDYLAGLIKGPKPEARPEVSTELPLGGGIVKGGFAEHVQKLIEQRDWEALKNLFTVPPQEFIPGQGVRGAGQIPAREAPPHEPTEAEQEAARQLRIQQHYQRPPAVIAPQAPPPPTVPPAAPLQQTPEHHSALPAAMQQLSMNVPDSIANALAAKPSINIPPNLISPVKHEPSPQEQRQQMAWLDRAQPATFSDQRTITNQFAPEPEGSRLNAALAPGGVAGGIAKIEGGARLRIDVAAPKGTVVRADKEGPLFHEIEMVRTNQMMLASDSD